MKQNTIFKLSVLTLALSLSTVAYSNPLISVPVDINTSKSNAGDYGDNNAGQGAALTNGISKSNANATNRNNGNSRANGGSINGNLGGNSGGNTLNSGNQGSSSGGSVGDVNTSLKNDVAGSTSTNTNSSNSNSNVGATTAKGNQTNTNIGGDTSSYSSTILWLPSHVVQVPPSLVAGAVVTTSVGACGVMQDVVTEKVEGTFNGILFDSKVDLGSRQHLVPAKTPFKEYKHGNLVFLIGHQTTIFSAVISTSGARQFGLGTNSGSGSGGSGSAGSSSGMQQMVQQIQLSECILSQVNTSK